MPAVNLSNKLNPNNMHFDKRLAEQYKYMSKTEKEMLWQQDRTEQLQALQVSPSGLTSKQYSWLIFCHFRHNSYVCRHQINTHTFNISEGAECEASCSLYSKIHRHKDWTFPDPQIPFSLLICKYSGPHIAWT